MRSILDIQNRREDARLKAMNPESPYSGFDLIADISHMIDEVIKREYQSLEKRIFGNELSPSAVFLYGSGGRNEMTNYSDIDIHFISTANDRRTTLFREGLHSALAQYKFGKIDDPNWANMDSLENYASRSITEANQIFDARLVVGDPRLAARLDEITARYDTPERKIRNMVFQRFYLEHYYLNRSTPEMPNVKYCSGGHRDLLTFDWFYNWISSTSGLPLKVREGMPQIQLAIEDLRRRELITAEEEQELFESVEFMILFRNEILHSNLETPDKGITHLDVPTMERTWHSSPKYFISLGASTPDQLLPLFRRHANVIKNAKKLIMDHVISAEGRRKGESWARDYEESFSAETSDRRREEIAKRSDVITRISSIWGMNYYADEELFNRICQQMADMTQGELLASMACSPQSSPELLKKITETSMEYEGLGYILRIIGRNPSASKETLETIAGNSSIDKRYRIVAELNLKEGLYTAITRAS